MTPPLEWTGYLPAVVSAVHALGVLLCLCRERVPGGGEPRRPRVAEEQPGREECGCVAGPSAVRVDVAAPPAAASLRVVVVAGITPGGGMAGEERVPW